MKLERSRYRASIIISLFDRWESERVRKSEHESDVSWFNAELLSEQLESFSFRSFEFIISDSFEIFFYDCILFSPGRFLEHVCSDYTDCYYWNAALN